MIKGEGYEIRVCRSASCPMAVVEAENLLPQLKQTLDEADLGTFFANLCPDSKKRLRFRVAVASCPNVCTQVQIADFGLIGQVVPTLDGDCVACGVCEEVCEEEAITLEDRWPLFHVERCLNCGLCIKACPKKVLKAEALGYKVLVGGKLGRHPQLAKEIAALAGEEQILSLLEKVLSYYKNYCRKGERLGTIIQREGWDSLLEFLHT